MGKPVNFEVKPRNNEDQARMIKRFVKKTKKEGLVEKVDRFTENGTQFDDMCAVCLRSVP